MRKNNKIIIVISIILVLVIASGVFVYLFLATDIFKGNKELFAKYLLQDIEKIENIIKLDTIETYQNLNNQEKYESNTNIEFIHSEGGEVSNPLNNFSIKLELQKDEEQQYFYGKGQLADENETYFATELIKDQEQYGIRFPEAFKQFVTIDQDENIQSLSDDIGTDEKALETIINIMESDEEIFSEEKFNTKKDTIIKEILKGTFNKQKNAMITYNNETTKTNAYSVTLTSEQVNKIFEEISEKTIEELDITELKVIVYEKKGQTIRTVIEIGENKIVIENSKQEGEISTKITYSNLSEEDAIECDLEITKTNSENQESIEIIANLLQGEANHEISFLSKMQKNDDAIDFDIEVSWKEKITTISLMLENRVKTGSEFEKTHSLTESNFKSLSSIEDKEKSKQIVDSIKEIVEKHFTEEQEALTEKLMIEEDQNEEQTEEETSTEGPSQSEINNFNAKFEFYAGEEVTSENVKVLLDIVKGNCNGHEIKIINSTEEAGTEAEEVENRTSTILYIKEGATKDESVQEALKQINDNKKYKVLITYKETNGLIDYITITEI